MTHALHGLHVSSIRDQMALPVAPPGNLMWTEIAGTDGGDYSRHELLGYTNIVRLNWSYGHGTIPDPAQYGEFATNCGAFVARSQGCHTWVIGNEPNHSQERPPSGIITPEDYAECFIKCYDAIKAVRPDDLVLPAPIAPYNWESGDCLEYLDDMAQELAANSVVDGWVLHAYTRAHDPALITSELRVDNEHWHFRTYRDQAAVVAKHALDVPLFLTEANPTKGWQNVNNGWIREALCEIDTWNQGHPHQVIRAVCPFRWHDPSRPEWSIGDKAGVVEDYTQAAELGYSWDSWDSEPGEPEPPDEEEPVSGFVNGNMALPFIEEPGHNNILVAKGWRAWWASERWHEQDQNPARPLKVGEYKPIFAANYPYRVLEGETCQCWFVQFGVMHGGIYQQVNVGAGKRVTFSVPFQAWCTEGQDPHVSDGEIYLRAGIDTRGGIDWQADSIDWGNWVRGEAEYASTSISTISQTGTITLFIHTWNKWALPGHNDIYVDAVTLAVEGEDDDVPPTPSIEGVLRVEITGPGGGPIQVQQVSGQGLIARLFGR